MAVPSGSGTEVLRGGWWNTQSTDNTTFAFDASDPTLGDETDTVPANHIITLIFANWCETANAAEEFHFWGTFDSKVVYLLQYQDLTGYDTFVWNTKFVLIGGDNLLTGTVGGADIDVIYSYLDQDWS